MLSAGNPYVLPSVLVAAGAYLALSLVTDLSVLIRIGVLIGVGIVLPIVLNRVTGGIEASTSPDLEDAANPDAGNPDDADSNGVEEA